MIEGLSTAVHFFVDGKKALDEKRYNEALSMFNKAVEVCPDSAIVCGFKGNIFDRFIYLL